LLKSYFQHPQDSRDRLGTEFAFCSFAWKNGIRSVPQPLAKDDKAFLALYEYIDGKSLRGAPIGAEAVAQAGKFFVALNRHKDSAEARALPPASEACFSFDDHLKCVPRRLKALEAVKESQAGEFIRGELAAAWEKISRRPLPQGEFSNAQRCLSPSDFGFHNALSCADGKLRFIDFEYAGWDDPAKMAADFFSQVSVPVPFQYFQAFLEQATEGMADAETVRRRADWILPIHRLKWICLMLNDFLPAGEERRRFAAGASEERRAVQLDKARRALRSMTEEKLWLT